MPIIGGGTKGGFPEPEDLKVPYHQMITDGQPKDFAVYSVENPHPNFGKDPNIINELGHTKFPMYVESKIEHKRVVVNNEMELAQHTDSANDWKAAPTKLREDGPTLQQYIDAGYKAATYPPFGYASKASDEEIKEAVEAEGKAPNPWLQTDANK